jgi:N-methylhydantoinase A
VYVDHDWIQCPIHDRDRLGPGGQIAGPAVIEEYGSTTLVFRGWSVRVDSDRNLIMTREES